MSLPPARRPGLFLASRLPSHLPGIPASGGFRGLGFRGLEVQGFRVWGLGLGVEGLGFRHKRL